MRPALTPSPLPPRGAAFTLYATLSAFLLYGSMYAFRKPYTAATFADGPDWLGFGYKEALVVAQIAGYALAKFLGIRIVSSASAVHRGYAIVGLIGASWLCLVAFGALPAVLGPLALFGNGLCLGMIWGLVFAYLEGRRNTEVLGLGLCASFVLAGGVVKDIGRFWLARGVAETWMPALTGACFLLPVLLLTALLERLPPPDARDVAQRGARAPMTRRQRAVFLRRFGRGLIPLVLLYVLLSAFRTFRDDFMADVWMALRQQADVPAFSATELPVALGTLLLLLPLVAFRRNAPALRANAVAIGIGLGGCALATLAFSRGAIGDFTWMLALGFGSYLAYIPFNAIFFDRLVALLRRPANAGFLIYIADAFGYLGSVLLVAVQGRWALADPVRVLGTVALVTGLAGLLLLVLGMRFFLAPRR